MVHCPECDADLTQKEDVEFVDIDSEVAFITSSKRFYVVGCADCGVAIGSGVAGAE